MPMEEVLPDIEVEAIYEMTRAVLAEYRRSLPAGVRRLLDQFELIQMARKVVGVGSVGTRAWILLLEGRNSGDPLFLQAKQAEASVLERFVNPSVFAHHGERVVAGQQAMQANSDILLGWAKEEAQFGIDLYLRQFRDWKGSIDVEKMIPGGMATYGRVCAWTLARAHARSGDRVAIAAYLGSKTVFDEAIATFAERYADLNLGDYATLEGAVRAGKITATKGR